jgi:hypothetical protein
MTASSGSNTDLRQLSWPAGPILEPPPWRSFKQAYTPHVIRKLSSLTWAYILSEQSIIDFTMHSRAQWPRLV